MQEAFWDKQMRIVIVEDNKSLASGIAHRLRDRGHAIDVLYDGLAGYEFLAGESCGYGDP